MTIQIQEDKIFIIKKVNKLYVLLVPEQNQDSSSYSYHLNQGDIIWEIREELSRKRASQQEIQHNPSLELLPDVIDAY